MQKVQVVSVEDCGYYSNGNTYGSTVTVTLQRGNVFAKCEDILIWEEEYAEDAFDEWMDLANAQEEGYTTWEEA
jgi:hypothetical protein